MNFCHKHIQDEAQANPEWRAIDFEEITPETWKWVELKLKELDGTFSTIKLRRPNWWLEQNHADTIGNQCYLEIPELLLAGEAEVVDIWPSLIDTRFEAFEASGENRYRPITGWFQRTAPEVWNFVFSTGDTIGSTPNHPFFSEKRQNYVPVGELEIGESVRLPAGKTAVLVSKKDRANGLELVCNLEVWRYHNYFVGREGLLVHNNCVKLKSLIDGISDATKAFHKPYKCEEYSKALRAYFKKKGIDIETKRVQLTLNGVDAQTVIGFDMPNGTTINISTTGMHEFTIINDKIFDNNIFDGIPIDDFYQRIHVPPGYEFREIIVTN